MSVEGGGCSGFQYKFDMVGAAEAEDIVIERDGARMLIDPVSLDYLKGSEVDFVDDLMGASFRSATQRAKLVRLRHELLGLKLDRVELTSAAQSQCVGAR